MHFHQIPLAFLTLIFASVLVVEADGQDRFAEQGFTTGKPVPDIVLPEVSGQKNGSLSDYRGKKLIVLHFASW